MTRRLQDDAQDDGALDETTATDEMAAEVASELVGGEKEPRFVRLTTLEHIRAEMARCYRAGKSGKVKPEDMNKLIWGLSQIKIVIEAIRDTGFEEKLLEIEARLGLVAAQGASNVRQLTAPVADRTSDEDRAS